MTIKVEVTTESNDWFHVYVREGRKQLFHLHVTQRFVSDVTGRRLEVREDGTAQDTREGTVYLSYNGYENTFKLAGLYLSKNIKERLRHVKEDY